VYGVSRAAVRDIARGKNWKHSWIAISWAIIGRYARIRNVNRFRQFVVVPLIVISGVGFLLLPFSIPTLGIFGDIVFNDLYWEDTYLVYLLLFWLLTAIVIGLLMPFVCSDMLDDFPPH